MKVALFWTVISAVVGAAAWTTVDAVRKGDDGRTKTAERILAAREARGLGKFHIDPDKNGDIWCPRGTGSVMFSGTEKGVGAEKAGRAVRGAICTSHGEAYIVMVE